MPHTEFGVMKPQFFVTHRAGLQNPVEASPDLAV